MTSVPPTSTPAGWYPDPWNGAHQRFWDGTQWTGYSTAPQAVQHPLVPTGRYSPEAGARAAKFGRIGVTVRACGAAALYAIAAVAIGLIFGNAISSSATSASPDGSGGLTALFIALWVAFVLFSVVIGLGSLACLMTWTYRINENARDLALRTKFSSGLACVAWIIPYANLVMPYFSVRGAVPDTDERGPFLTWWLVYVLLPVANSIGFMVAMIGAIFGIAGGIAGGAAAVLIAVAVAVTEYRCGVRVVRLVQHRHDEIASSVSSVVSA